MRAQFGEFVFDEERRELTRAGKPIHLSPKAFDLLAILIARHPGAVRKEVLYEALWPESFVEYANLNNLVSEIRSAIGDTARSMLQTKPRFGFAFAAETMVEADHNAEPRDRLFRIVWGGRSFDLEPGRNLIGRELDCVIIIDSPAVSRYHAVIEVRGSVAILEDLGSKNGTFLDKRRIDAPSELHDRDEIEIGRALLRFRTFERKATTVSDPR
ncbi:MAG TPA: FHA domain-containing protein [Thermoanaerobaculia bacterium]|nr:FHA domain-containing protein [Thermoanaerobaculia bacterium]